MTIGTRIYTWLCGRKVGEDQFGTSYYESRNAKADGRKKRWAMFKGVPEPSKVPPLWRRWLHHTTNDVPAKDAPVYGWEKPHIPNLTGTVNAYVPPGHIARGGVRDEVSSDYQPWNP